MCSIQFSIVKGTIQWHLAHSQSCATPTSVLFQNIPISSDSPAPPQPLATTDPLSASVVGLFRGTAVTHDLSFAIRLLSLGTVSSRSIHIVACVRFVPFRGHVISHVGVDHVVCPFIPGPTLGCVCLLAVVNTHERVFWRTHACSSRGRHLGVEWWGLAWSCDQTPQAGSCVG